MNHATLVRVSQCVGDLAPDSQHLADLERTLGDLDRQRLAVDVLHRDEGGAAVGADFVDSADGRVIERGGALRFTQQLIVVAALAQDLDRQRPLEHGVVRAIDGAHAAGANQRVDPVSAQSSARSERARGIHRSLIYQRGPRNAASQSGAHPGLADTWAHGRAPGGQSAAVNA